jgi:hypothetical protein
MPRIPEFGILCGQDDKEGCLGEAMASDLA